MIKLAQLTRFLIELNLVAAEQIDSWVENPRIVPSGKSLGNGQIVMYRHEYDAVIVIERYPHKVHSAQLLFAHICSWVMNNDDRDEIARPRIDVDILDDDTADIEISISFEEDGMVVEDPAGDIELYGKRYRLDDAVINYAETGEVTT